MASANIDILKEKPISTTIVELFRKNTSGLTFSKIEESISDKEKMKKVEVILKLFSDRGLIELINNTYHLTELANAKIKK